MPEQQRSLKGVGISFLLVVVVLAFILSGCSIKASQRIDYLPVFSLENLESLPIEKHNEKDDASWIDDLKKYNKEADAKQRQYTKTGITRNSQIVTDYKKKHPEDIILRQKVQDGQWIVKIWTDDEVKNINNKFVSMKK